MQCGGASPISTESDNFLPGLLHPDVEEAQGIIFGLSREIQMQLKQNALAFVALRIGHSSGSRRSDSMEQPNSKNLVLTYPSRIVGTTVANNGTCLFGNPQNFMNPPKRDFVVWEPGSRILSPSGNSKSDSGNSAPGSTQRPWPRLCSALSPRPLTSTHSDQHRTERRTSCDEGETSQGRGFELERWH